MNDITSFTSTLHTSAGQPSQLKAGQALAQAKPQSLEQLQAWVEQRIAELHGEQDTARLAAMRGLAEALEEVLYGSSFDLGARQLIMARAALEAAKPFLERMEP